MEGRDGGEDVGLGALAQAGYDNACGSRVPRKRRSAQLDDLSY